MKNYLAISIITILLFGISCQNKFEKEKTAIIKVIEESTSAYKARDSVRINNVYLHDESTTRLFAGKYGFNYEKGWKEIADFYKTSFDENPFAITTKYEKTNYVIKVYRKSACVFHDEIIYDSENEYSHHQIGVHFLEKIKGEWKIVYLSYIDTSSYEEETREE